MQTVQEPKAAVNHKSYHIYGLESLLSLSPPYYTKAVQVEREGMSSALYRVYAVLAPSTLSFEFCSAACLQLYTRLHLFVSHTAGLAQTRNLTTIADGASGTRTRIKESWTV